MATVFAVRDRPSLRSGRAIGKQSFSDVRPCRRAPHRKMLHFTMCHVSASYLKNLWLASGASTPAPLQTPPQGFCAKLSLIKSEPAGRDPIPSPASSPQRKLDYWRRPSGRRPSSSVVVVLSGTPPIAKLTGRRFLFGFEAGRERCRFGGRH